MIDLNLILLGVKIIESSYQFAYGARNRGCRLSTAHGKERMPAVLSAMDFADFPPLSSCIFVYKKT